MDDQDKALITSRYNDLTFVGDVTSIKCRICSKVAINHVLCNCNNLFCANCKINVLQVCPYCNIPTRLITRKDSAVEDKLCDVIIRCPNTTYGCTTITQLRHLPSHLKCCNFSGSQTSYNELSKFNAMSQSCNAIPQPGIVMPRPTSVKKLINRHLEQINLQNTNDHQPMQATYSPYGVDHMSKQSPFQSRMTLNNSTPGLSEPMNEQSQYRTNYTGQNLKTSKPKNHDEMRSPVPVKDYNILLLGQTGVGKSTFINALANYLNFNSLNDAMNAKPLALIPCQFTISDENYQQKEIKFGTDINENMGKKGQSSTQNCKAYTFTTEGNNANINIRLIDTPGIGDTRGVDKDKQNLKEILTFLSDFDKLYGICILLKPNESRLTPSFAFCMKQLLCHLHANASNNICFVFSNSRNTFYRPGDSVAPLKTLLEQIRNSPPNPIIPFSKTNIFCLDNEAFRFLVAHKTITFGNEEIENFAQSWLKSVHESQRMINYIVYSGMTPHDIEDTIRVNQARDAIINLSRPLTDIAKNIQQNLQVLTLHKQEIINCKGDSDQLNQQLYIPTVSLNIKDLEQPRTVCAGENCRVQHKVGDKIIYHYPIKCHDPCTLKEVPKDVEGQKVLWYCSCIKFYSGNCRKCGCHYTKHMHIYYESEVIETKIVDANIQSQLATTDGTLQAAETLIEQLEDEIKKYEAEEAALRSHTVILAMYLKQNAMVAYNDSFKEYVTEQIENEKSLAQKGSNNAKIIKGLQSMLEHYEKEKEAFDKAIDPKEDKMYNSYKSQTITPEEVQHVIQQLSNMKISGVAFKRAYQAQGKLQPSGEVVKTGAISKYQKTGLAFLNHLAKQIALGPKPRKTGDGNP